MAAVRGRFFGICGCLLALTAGRRPALGQGTSGGGDEDCSAQTHGYLRCVTDVERLKGVWAFRRPFGDHAAVDQCFASNGCPVTPRYDRSLFADFVKLWQDVSDRTWSEYLNTPEPVKQCVRAIVSFRSRARIDQCLAASQIAALPAGYTEGLELPYCVRETPDRESLEQMKIGLKEKVAVLHQLHDCKANAGVEAAKQTVQCLDSLKANFTRRNFCPISKDCTREKVSKQCRPVRRRIVDSACACASQHRSSLLNDIEYMYRTASLEVVKLTPAFLGLDLTPEAVGPLKRCYADRGLAPISGLNALDNPALALFRGFQPRPQGMQAIRNLVYAQLELPDFCEICTR